MELPIQIRSGHYDKSKGKQFALNVDGNEGNSSDAYFQRYIVEIFSPFCHFLEFPTMYWALIA